MEKYNYREAMYSDIMDYIKWNNCELDYEKLYDDLWIDDSVTGNASGSYTCNTWQAEEYLCHNMDLLEDALSELGYDGIPLDKGAEWCDVTIRCYLLGEVLGEVINDLEEEIEEVEP